MVKLSDEILPFFFICSADWRRNLLPATTQYIHNEISTSRNGIAVNKTTQPMEKKSEEISTKAKQKNKLNSSFIGISSDIWQMIIFLLSFSFR